MGRQTHRFGLVLAAGLCAAAAWNASNRSPQLEISPEFDLGEVEHDKKIEVKVSFRNAGEAVLVLDSPITGCTCSDAQLSAREIPPGGMGSFQFTYVPAGYPGQVIQHDVVVPSNDPRDPRRSIRIRGRMRSRLVAAPESILVDDAHCGAEWTREVVVRCTDAAAEYQITGYDCDLPGTRIDGPYPYSDPMGPNSAAWLFLVSRVPTGIGRTEGELTIHTNHAAYSEVRVLLAERCSSRLTAFPPSVLLSPQPDAAEQTATISGEQTFRVVALPDDPESLYTVSAEPESDSKWIVRVGLRPGAAPAEVYRGDIRLQLEGVDHEPEFLLPCSIVPGISHEAAGDAPIP